MGVAGRCQVPWKGHRDLGSTRSFASLTSVDLIFTACEVRPSLAALMLLDPVSTIPNSPYSCFLSLPPPTLDALCEELLGTALPVVLTFTPGRS